MEIWIVTYLNTHQKYKMQNCCLDFITWEFFLDPEDVQQKFLLLRRISF